MAAAPKRPQYADVRSDLKTGDLVLFSGASFFSSVIKWAIGGKWSHVGIVVRSPKFPERVLLWESTTLADLADIETGKKQHGVQLVPLSERLKGYNGEFKLRPLDKPITPEMDAALTQLRANLSGRPYEESKLELVRSAFKGWFGRWRGERLNSLFCSELVAEAYQAMGLLPQQPPSNDYTPRDFARKNRRLLGGYALGKIIPVG
jgi:hypothetical protein